MVSAPRIVEDGLEAPERKSQRPLWRWLAAGLLIGVGSSVLVFRVDAGSTSSATTTATTVADRRAAPVLGGIADVVEGFPDGLMTVTRSDGQSLELLVWPLRGEAYERTIPVGVSSPPGPVSFDVTGRRIATLLPVSEQALGVLYAGIPQSAEIIATDVTGYAWHDSDPFKLAYTTFVDGELILWVERPDRIERELVARVVGIQGEVAAWGEWGYAIHDEVRDNIVLFTETGEIKDTHPGRVLASHATGWLAIDNDGISLLSAGGGVRGLDREGLDGGVLAGRFSDDREQLALLTIDSVLVLSLEDDSELLESGGRPGVPQITWSSDGRFLLYPGLRGIWVIDTRNGEVDEIIGSRTFTGLGVAPLSSS